MKIGFLTAYRGQKVYGEHYQAIVSYLNSMGHEVTSNLDIQLEEIVKIPYVEREKIFLNFYKKLLDCTIVFVECSMQSTQVGFGIAYLRSQGKPVVLLSLHGAPIESIPHVTFSADDTESNMENFMIATYKKESLKDVLKQAMEYMETIIDKRFNMVVPAHLYTRLEELSKKKKVPKAVYIRQLIEKDILASS